MHNKTLKITIVGVFATLAYISFTFLQIPISTPGGTTAFHLGNTFCVLAALLVGGVPGGLAGAIGMGLADIMDPRYVVYTPKTIVLKLGIGILTGFIAHKVLHLKDKETRTSIFITALLSSSAGMLFNIIFDPIIGYLYNHFILGINAEASSILANWATITTTVNAVLTVLCASALYTLLYPRIKHLSIFEKIRSI